MTFEFLDTAFAFVTPNRLLIGLAVAFLATLNVMTYVIYRGDKLRAMFNEPRVPERSLLALAFYGGSLGAKVAQLQFRHKTRKKTLQDLPKCDRYFSCRFDPLGRHNRAWPVGSG